MATRVTHYVADINVKLKIPSWVVQARVQKWRFARRCATMDKNRWNKILLNLDPQVNFDGRATSARGPAHRPKTRWSDDMVKTFLENIDTDNSWKQGAQDKHLWRRLEDIFAYRAWSF